MSLRRVFRLPESVQRSREEIELEMEFHIRGRAEQFIARGMEPSDAYVEARRRFGSVRETRDALLTVNEQARRRRKWAQLIQDIAQDFRFAARSLRRRPAFLATSLAVLTIGIAGVVAMYAVVDGVLLQKLPYREPAQLVSIYTTFPHWKAQPVPGVRWDGLRSPYPDYLRLSADRTVFSAVAGFNVEEQSLSTRNQSTRIAVGSATANLMEVLGVSVAHGRWFLPGEDGPRATRLAVISHEFRARVFGQEDVLGKTLMVGETPYVVVGVLGPRFALEGVDILNAVRTRRADVWLPIGVNPGSLQAGNHTLELIGRLRPGVSIEQAQFVADRLLRGDLPVERRGARVTGRGDSETIGVKRPIWLLFGAVGLLMVITCANVASLFLGECASREQELRTRAALGAGRARLVRLLAIEGAWIAGVSGALGLVLGAVMIRVVLQASPISLPHSDLVGVSSRVAIFTVGVAALATLLAGVVPAFMLMRAGATQSYGVRVAAGRSRVQQVALVLQSAVSVVLIAAAILLGRSLANTGNIDPGFRADGILAIEAELPRSAIAAAGSRAIAAEQLRRTIADIPGVRSVAAVSYPPLIGRTNGQTIRPDPSLPAGANVERMIVSANYFTLLRIPVLAGRDFLATDTAGGAEVAIVSEAFARRFWPVTSAIGRTFKHPNGTPTIVGVVGNVVNTSFGRAPEPVFYQPLGQGSSASSFLADVGSDAAVASPAIQRGIWNAAPSATIARVAPMEDLVSAARAPDRFRTLVATGFAAIALLVTAVGIAGLAARSVASRVKEWCIRLALGAPMRDVLALAVRDGYLAAIVGTVIGLIAAQFSSRWLGDYLFGLNSTDPTSHLLTAGITIVVCGTAMFAAASRLRHFSLAAVLRGE